ncbi:hypothetical protein KFE98_18700 [bacterium SCSIO 12741]|nr:hypothetical protein KFE98_18700 [bacterium SCSIO 12741]
MDAFKNPLEKSRFESTNGPWNRLRLNDPWSVGYVSSLIVYRDFRSKEDWEAFYYQSGELRNNRLLELAEQERQQLNNFRLILTHPKEVYKIDPSLRGVNTSYGRTQEQLMERAAVLYQFMLSQGSDLSLMECFHCVWFRTIGQTWNGIVLREKNTLQRLADYFPDCTWKNTDGQFDHRYAVDYEMFKNGERVAAIQIKPRSYQQGNQPYLIKAREANRRKNEAYKRLFGCEVFDIISTTDGSLLNTEVLDRMRLALQN